MADSKISALTSGNPAQSGDEIPIARGGANYKITAGSIASLSGNGDVVGPASATDNAITRFDLTTGKLVQNSGVTIDDSNNLTLPGQADLRFADSDSSNWVAFQAPATVASNVTWTLPNADGTSGQVLSTDGSGTLSWATGGGGGGSGTVTSVAFSTGTTGLSVTGSPITTSGTITLAGTLGVANGGTGATTLTGLVKGSGTSAFSAATAGTDYVAPAGAFSGLSWQSVQTTGFTAVAFRAYPCNTTSAAFTVTLPASPSAGDQITLTDYAGTWGTNNLTINPNGLKINGNTANATLSTNRGSVQLVYVDSTQGWVAYSGFAATSLPQVTPTVDYLVVAGGGGGGGDDGGGGGGAGGFRTGTGLSVTAGTSYTVTVGSGGTGGVGAVPGANGVAGGNSVFSTITSAGGGFGGGGTNLATAGAKNGGSGGSGGGGVGYTATSATGGSGNTPSTSPSQGNNGGGMTTNGFIGGGGGGGASQVGANGSGTGAAGGNGTASSITGSSVTYAGGGGGGQNLGASVGAGGTGGGGNGGSTTTAATAGSPNLGGGGGGGRNPGNGGNGGSGVVIIAYPDVYLAATATTGSPTVTTSGGYRIYKWTGNGSITF